jgi:hypothetical protein
MTTTHRLDGFEPDNLLAFLALLGLLRAIEARDALHSKDERFLPRASWDLGSPPLRPVMHVAQSVSREEVAQAAAEGLEILAPDHDFSGRMDLDYSRQDAHSILDQEAGSASVLTRGRVDLFAALMTDGAIKDEKKDDTVVPTPLCLLFGQGHQHFLDRLTKVPMDPAPSRGGGRKNVRLTAAEYMAETLFATWRRQDRTFSFRWDPEEDVRYALMAGDPTDITYKPGTQHGANRLAAVGLPLLTVVPQKRLGKVRISVIGGEFGADGFSFAWPIWKQPTTLVAIRRLLSHPDLRNPGPITYLGVDHVLIAHRISVGKFMNFSRARPADNDGYYER